MLLKKYGSAIRNYPIYQGSTAVPRRDYCIQDEYNDPSLLLQSLGIKDQFFFAVQ
jgi:hypothetical protein